MRRPESDNSVILNILPIVGAISGAVLAYTSGWSEVVASNMRTVNLETWKTLPEGVQDVAFAGLKVSTSCFYGFTVGLATDQIINSSEYWTRQAVKIGLAEKFYQYHPARFLSTLR